LGAVDAEYSGERSCPSAVGARAVGVSAGRAKHPHRRPPLHAVRIARFSSGCHDRPLSLSLSIIGALVEMRILLCGLTAFILTLAFSFWHDRGHDAVPVAHTAPEPLKEDSLVPTSAAPSTPLAPSPAAISTPAAAPAPVTAVNQPPAAVPDVDDEAMLVRRDRGTERSSRSR
jgi:hypothetical protein